MDMILEKLTKIEVALKYSISSEYKKIETIRGFKELLNQIDFSSEIVPFEDSERLTKVLTSLKGKDLNRCESNLVEELIVK